MFGKIIQHVKEDMNRGHEYLVIKSEFSERRTKCQASLATVGIKTTPSFPSPHTEQQSVRKQKRHMLSRMQGELKDAGSENEHRLREVSMGVHT